MLQFFVGLPCINLIAMITTRQTLLLSKQSYRILEYTQQGRNHVFKVGGPILWSSVLLPFYKKLDRSAKFGAVGYIITLYSSKSNVKSWGSVQIFGRSGPALVVAPMLISRQRPYYQLYILMKTRHLIISCSQQLCCFNSRSRRLVDRRFWTAIDPCSLIGPRGFTEKLHKCLNW